MQTKLTLSVDAALTPLIKNYAKQRKTSVSRLVEEYFRKMITSTTWSRRKADKYPISHGLLGSVQAKSKQSDRELITEYLEEKYL